jgi:hypothetical protein
MIKMSRPMRQKQKLLNKDHIYINTESRMKSRGWIID